MLTRSRYEREATLSHELPLSELHQLLPLAGEDRDVDLMCTLCRPLEPAWPDSSFSIAAKRSSKQLLHACYCASRYVTDFNSDQVLKIKPRLWVAQISIRFWLRLSSVIRK